MMPALARLASGRATTFRNAYAAAPATQPSMKAIFTAQLPSHWGVGQTAGPPPPEVWNLATAFRESGYRTAAFSANGVIDGLGFRSGFDDFWTASGLRLMQRSFLLRRILCGSRRALCEIEFSGRLRLHKEDGSFIHELVHRWLKDAPRPFLLYVHLIDPHWPFYDRGFGFRDERLRTLDDPYRHWELLQLEKGDPANARLRDAPQFDELLARYYEEVRHTDGIVGRILDDLRDVGVFESSLIVVVGDHGEEFFEHLGFGHGHDVYDEQLHVPLVIKWPSTPDFEGMPRLVETPVSLVDLLPTLTDYLALQAPPSPVKGRSLRTALEAGAVTDRRPVWSEIRYGDHVHVGYREGDRKVRFVYPYGATPLQAEVEVFDLIADPGEQQPLAPDHDRRLVNRARRELQQNWLAATRDRRPEAPTPEPAYVKQLRILGYLGE